MENNLRKKGHRETVVGRQKKTNEKRIREAPAQRLNEFNPNKNSETHDKKQRDVNYSKKKQENYVGKNPSSFPLFKNVRRIFDYFHSFFVFSLKVRQF